MKSSKDIAKNENLRYEKVALESSEYAALSVALDRSTVLNGKKLMWEQSL